MLSGKEKSILFCAVVCVVCLAATSFAFAQEAEYAEGEVLVILKGSSVTRFSASSEEAAEVIMSRAMSLGATVNAEPVEAYPEISRGATHTLVHMRSETDTSDELIEKLKSNPDVAGVAKNYVSYPDAMTPNDARWNDQWGTQRINAASVWNSNENMAALSQNVVAIFDTGVKYDHEDLQNQMFVFAEDHEANPAGTHGMWFYRDRSGSQQQAIGLGSAGDVQGHGTHVAGIVAAQGNNGVGVAGVNWNARILPINVYSPAYDANGNIKGYPSAYDSDIIKGVDYLLGLQDYLEQAGSPLKAANLSLGSWRKPVNQLKDPLGTAIKRMSDAGIIVVIAAGNEGVDLDNPTGSYAGLLPYPAGFTFKNTLTVGASDATGKAAYTNFSTSRNLVDLLAPGSNILSTTYDGKYAYMNGSSMAAPMVAGSASLLFAAKPNRCAAEVRTIILATTNLDVEPDGSHYGVLNVGAANNKLSILKVDYDGAEMLGANQALEGSKAIVRAHTKIDVADMDSISDRTSLAADHLDTACPFGNVVLTFDLLDKQIDSLIAEDEVAYDISSVPIFQVDNVDANELSAIPLHITDVSELGTSFQNLRMMKAISATEGRYYKYTDNPANYADGCYTILHEDGTHLTSDTIDQKAKYIIVLFIQDNGPFDLDKTAGRIIDPTVQFSVMPIPDPTVVGGDGGGSGGGCNAIPFMALLALVPGLLVIGKQKQR